MTNNKIKVKVEIESYDRPGKGIHHFGYNVTNNVSESRELDYQNRATLVGNQYLLEEKYWPGNPFPLEKIGVVRGHKKADKILYERASQAAKKALESVVVELVDKVAIFLKTKKKFLKEQKTQRERI